MQVLGSGGPELQGGRASSGYLLWLNGQARVLIDLGGGVALRYGESGAGWSDLDVVLFSHFHVDHSTDLSALVKASRFGGRSRPLPLYGPAGGAGFPGTSHFVKDLFGEEQGAFGYLSDFLQAGDGRGYKLQPHDVEPGASEVRQVWADDRIRIRAVRVIHGPVPALAWRLDTTGKSVVFSGDTNGTGGNLEKLAQGADLLIAHHAIPEGAGGVERSLHMPPSVIGRIAGEAKVGRLVLSHRMLRTLGKEQESMAVIRRSYQGPVTFASDLECFSLH